MRVVIAAALVLALALATPAAAGVITFDDVSFTPTGFGAARQFVSVVSGGFVFTANSFHLVANPDLCGLGGCVSNGTQYLVSDALFQNGIDGKFFGGPVSMARTDGSLFTLQAFDGAGLHPTGVDPSGDSVWVVGHLPDGGILRDAWGVGQDFRTISFGSAWTGLVSVEWSGLDRTRPGSVALDNIVTEPVPDPSSTLLLFGISLVGLRAWRKRRQ